MPKKFSGDKHLGGSRRLGHRSRSRAAGQSASGAIDALLARRPQLALKAVQAAENSALMDALRALLPAELAPHACSAQQQRTELIVTADTAAWSGRLRYALAAALPELQRRWPTLKAVRLRVGPV